MANYGHAVVWPQAPNMICKQVRKLRAAYDRWRSWMVIRAIPSHDWPQLRLKVTRISSLIRIYQDIGIENYEIVLCKKFTR